MTKSITCDCCGNTEEEFYPDQPTPAMGFKLIISDPCMPDNIRTFDICSKCSIAILKTLPGLKTKIIEDSVWDINAEDLCN